MKRLFTLLILLLIVSGCSKQNNIANMENPIKEKESLQEINELANTNILEVENSQKSRYSIIDGDPIVAQYDFELNGYEWTIRAAKEVNNDISGIYDEYNTFEPNGNFTLYTNDYYMERHFYDDTQYIYTLKNPGNFSEVEFCNIVFECESKIEGTFIEPDYTGEYQDYYSERATATVSKDDDGYLIVVHWANDSSSYREYTMHATRQLSRLVYTGENIKDVKVDENGNEEIVNETAANNLGYFIASDFELDWNGAAEENCRLCCFEKILEK